MLNSLRKIFTLPVPEGDDAESLAIRTLRSYFLIMTAVLALLAAGIIFVFVKKAVPVALLVGLFLLLITSRAIARGGRTRHAGAVLVYGLWLLATVQIVLSGGLNTVVSGVYVAMIPVAGVLLGGRAAITIALLSVAASLGMTVSASIGYPLPSYYPMPPWSAWITLMLCFILTAPAMSSAIRRFEEALEATRVELAHRKETAEELRESEEMLKAILAASPVGIVLTQQSRIKWANNAWVKMFAFDKEDEYLDQPTRIMHPSQEDYEHVRHLVYDDIAPEHVSTADASLRRKDGMLFDGQIRANLVDGRDPAKGTISVISDMSERKKVEEDLRRSEQKYRTLFENSPIGIISVDASGRILEINQMLLDALGSPSVEATKAINMFELPQLVQSGVSALFRSCISSGEPLRGDLPYTSKWGKRSHMRIILTPMKDRNGETYGCQAVMEDVVEQRRLDEQQRQAQKLEAVGTLAGGIAHEFNNILQVTQGYSELLLSEKSEQDPDYSDLLKIQHAARSGAELVRSLLTFSRKVEPRLVPMNLNGQIVSVEQLLRRTIPRMIDIRLELAGDLQRINADAGQMGQIVMNLALNARDAMPDGGTLTIETANVTVDEAYCRVHVEAQPGEHVLLSVTDTGHGMDPVTLEHIFEPFYTTKDLTRGPGLGLPTVYGIVKQHGGHVTCFSEVGKGTTFQICLPALTNEQADAPEARPEASAAGTETVLLVDDEDLVRELGERILTRSGYRVITAACGEEALELYDRHKDQIGLVILDLIMPGMGGKNCLRELLKAHPAAKVLIASGYAADEGMQDCVTLGARGLVAKPFRFAELLWGVRKSLDQA